MRRIIALSFLILSLNSYAEEEIEDTILEPTPVNCKSQPAGPLGKPVTSINCKLDPYVDLLNSGLLNSTWTDESLKSGILPRGLRRHVDWRYKFGDRPANRADDATYWMGFGENVRQCGGTCPSAAFFHFAELSRMVQTLTPHVRSSWTYGYANRIRSNIRNTFRVLGLPLDKMDESLPNADCRYLIKNEDGTGYSRCVDGPGSIYDLFQDKYGEMCKAGDQNWWDSMAMQGLNGVKSVPQANIYRGNISSDYFFKSLNVTRQADGYHTQLWTPSDRFKGYSENALLMYLVDHYGPLIMSYKFARNPNDNYRRKASLIYRDGKHGRMVYGSDLLIGNELPGRPANPILLNPGDTISSPTAQHTQVVVGYRYIPEHPESSYWIMLNSHGDNKEHGFNYFHMTIGAQTHNIIGFWIPSMFWNKLGLPIRRESKISKSRCTAVNCEFDNNSQSCKCTRPAQSIL